jgi:hypothetical protein
VAVTWGGIVSTFAIVILLATSSQAQTSPSGPQADRSTSGHNNIIPCDSLPAGAVRAVPAPFDRYMQFKCFEALGQGLGPVENFHWADPRGFGMGLSATSAAGRPDANGQMQFPFSWYTQLVPVALSPKEQQALRTDFRQAITPRFLVGATILELKAVTSNAEQKRIYLIVPDTKPGPPKWLLGFECNGACYRDDRQPMTFFGEPNG